MRARLLFVGLLLSAGLTFAQPIDLSTAGVGPEVTRLEHNNLVYVAEQSGGVAVVDVSDPAAPKVIGRFAEGRFISRMLLAGDEVILFETREEATTWTLADPRAPALVRPGTGPAVAIPTPPAPRPEKPSPPQAPQTPTPAPTPAPVARAKVAEVRGGRVIFDGAGFAVGQNVRIVAQRLEKKPDLVTGELVDMPSGEVTAVVKIEEAQGNRFMARLGRGDTAEPGDLAEPTNEPISERLLVPRRSPFSVLAGFHVRPFLGLGATASDGSTSKPFGFLTDAYVTWYSEQWPLALSASVAPAGFSIGSQDAHYPIATSVTAAYATDFFEIGLGVGGLVGAEGPCIAYGPNGPIENPTCEVNTGVTIDQTLRLGAVDGLNILWRSSIFSRPDQFVFGIGRGELNVPLTRQLGLFGAGGAGENGWAFGEFGVRTYVGGIGARGTVVLSASLGYASIFDGPSHESVGGPSVAFGAEWRL